MNQVQTLETIKSQLSVSKLRLEKMIDPKNGSYQGWLKHWENDTRITIMIPEALLLGVKDDPNLPLELSQPMKIHGNKGVYTRFKILDPDWEPEPRPDEDFDYIV